jgi:hypothetical protein
MKKILAIACLFFVLSSKGQALTENDLIRVSNYQSPTPAKYRLYPTFNRFNFLRLNTTNGVIDQVQYDTEGKNRGVSVLNIFPLVENGSIDRFTLYPTLNNWTFILLDQIEGTTYQVQWGFESKNRMILQIDK